MTSRWALVTPEAISIRRWPDASVLFNARESTTLMLSVEAGAIVTSLKSAPADASALIAAMSGATSCEEDVLDLLAALSEHGIVRTLG